MVIQASPLIAAALPSCSCEVGNLEPLSFHDKKKTQQIMYQLFYTLS